MVKYQAINGRLGPLTGIPVFFFFLLLFPNALTAKVKVYPAPEGAKLSNDYTVTVDGQKVAVYFAPGRPEWGGNYSFAYFDCSGNANIEVTSSIPLDSVVIRPESRAKNKSFEGKKLKFSIASSPCQVSVEPDGINSPLFLFANPIEINPPKEGDPGVIYYGPGLHKPGIIKLTDNQTLYISGGAVVKAGVHAEGKNIKIMGRGILDGVDWERLKGPQHYLLSVENANNVTVQDIILKDSWLYAFMMGGSSNLSVSNLKVIGTRCANEDGIDICNSSGVKIQDCFVRTDDDNIAIKGTGYNGKAVDSVMITRCVFWTDVANIFRIGAESHADAMQNITAEDIDIIHQERDQERGSPYSLRYDYCFTIQPAENMPIRNLRFENIRVNWEGQYNFIECRPYLTSWSKPPEGNIDGVLFKDIVATGKKRKGLGRVVIWGASPQHDVKNITLKNVTWFGECIDRNSRDVTIAGSTGNIVFDCAKK